MTGAEVVEDAVLGTECQNAFKAIAKREFIKNAGNEWVVRDFLKMAHGLAGTMFHLAGGDTEWDCIQEGLSRILWHQECRELIGYWVDDGWHDEPKAPVVLRHFGFPDLANAVEHFHLRRKLQTLEEADPSVMAPLEDEQTWTRRKLPLDAPTTEE